LVLSFWARNIFFGGEGRVDCDGRVMYEGIMKDFLSFFLSSSLYSTVGVPGSRRIESKSFDISLVSTTEA